VPKLAGAADDQQTLTRDDLGERAEGAEREQDRLRRELERVERERDRLRRDNDRLKRQLEEARRAAHRQAAPFAKALASHPRRPGRKAGRTLASKHTDDGHGEGMKPTTPRCLAGLAAGERVHVLSHREADLDRFLNSLAHAWREGEVRPTHRRGPKPPRHWRTRKDPFEAAWPRMVTWLESEPDRTAKEPFARLREGRVKEWRTLSARRLVFAEPLADVRHHATPAGCAIVSVSSTTTSDGPDSPSA
jgi:hypothetical protein